MRKIYVNRIEVWFDVLTFENISQQFVYGSLVHTVIWCRPKHCGSDDM